MVFELRREYASILKTTFDILYSDVLLPPWSNGDPRAFVRILREALESTYVSANLHHWIGNKESLTFSFFFVPTKLDRYCVFRFDIWF